jgi:hypothetical protein
MGFGLVRGMGAIAFLAMLLGAHTSLQAQGLADASSSDSAFSIPKAQLIQPDELNRLLKAQGAQRPLVLQVGSHLMFSQAHIVGSEYAGPGSQPAGLKLLQDRVSPLPHSTFIVIYCGCCPWERCPNIGPAFKLLHDLGFNNVKALFIADNFGATWVDKGYPVERGR